MPPAPPPTVFRFDGEDWTVDGNGEVCVTQPNGTCWTAPRLLIHYVLSHGYLPPAGFLEAVLAGRRVPVTNPPGGFVAATIPVSMHEEMRGRALAFLINVEDRLPKDFAQMASESIDANEACLAVQFMRAVLVRQQASLTVEEQRDLQGMLKAMGLGSPDP